MPVDYKATQQAAMAPNQMLLVLPGNAAVVQTYDAE
jgi:hypothetical protein